MYRLSLTRIIAIILIITLCVLVWNIFSDDNDDRSEIVQECNMTNEYLNDLEDLLKR